MKTTQYPIVCPSCNGGGKIGNYPMTVTDIYKDCPACNGSGVVIKTETETDYYPPPLPIKSIFDT